MRPQLVQFLQHQTAVAGTLLRHARCTGEHTNARCLSAAMRNGGTQSAGAHLPWPALGSGVVCPGWFQENSAKAGHSKQSSTNPGRGKWRIKSRKHLTRRIRRRVAVHQYLTSHGAAWKGRKHEGLIRSIRVDLHRLPPSFIPPVFLCSTLFSFPFVVFPLLP